MNAAPECRRPDQDTASAEGGLCAVPWGVFAREGWAPDSRGTGVEGSAFVPETTMPPAIELGGTVDVSAAQTLEPLLTSGAGGVLRGGSATACSPRAMASKTSRRCTGTSLGASTPRRTLSPRISTTTIVMSLLMTMHSSFFRDKTSIDRGAGCARAGGGGPQNPVKHPIYQGFRGLRVSLRGEVAGFTDILQRCLWAGHSPLYSAASGFEARCQDPMTASANPFLNARRSSRNIP